MRGSSSNARQLEEQRRRAEEALRLELRRQAADRELGRLRLLAGTALVGWIASVVMLGGAARRRHRRRAASALAAGWLLLLGALGAAFTAQGRVGASASDSAIGARRRPRRSRSAASWLLHRRPGVTAISLLFAVAEVTALRRTVARRLQPLTLRSTGGNRHARRQLPLRVERALDRAHLLDARARRTAPAAAAA